MKKFIIKTTAFFITIVIVMGGNYIFNTSRLKQDLNLKDTKILLAGDSRIMTGIDPELIPQSKNIAQNSESYLITYYKLRRILDQQSQVKTIILGFSYPSFSAYLDGIFKNDIATSDVFNRIYPIMSPEDFGPISIDKEKYYLARFKNLLVYPHSDHQKYMGGFQKLKYGLDKADLNSVILRHYFDKDSVNIGISKYAYSYLDSIRTICEQKNIRLVLVNMPFHKDYLEKIPENFKRYYQDKKTFLEQKGQLILDYEKLPMEDQYFKDYNHLDYEGAIYFTNILIKDLEENMIIP